MSVTMDGPSRRTFFQLLLVAPALAACVSEVPAAQEDGGARQSERDECIGAEPPVIVMTSLAGEHVGVHGSYCAWQAGTSCGSCRDGPTILREFTVVHPDDEVTFSMHEGTLMEGEGCEPACPPTLRIQRMGCEESMEEQRLIEEDYPWRVGLTQGIYALSVESNFEGVDGWGGQISIGFGLVVDLSIDRAVVDADTVESGCKQ